MALQARILDSVVFSRDMEVGRQDGHQLQTELDLNKLKWKGKHVKNEDMVDSGGNIQHMLKHYTNPCGATPRLEEV